MCISPACSKPTVSLVNRSIGRTRLVQLRFQTGDVRVDQGRQVSQQRAEQATREGQVVAHGLRRSRRGVLQTPADAAGPTADRRCGCEWT